MSRDVGDIVSRGYGSLSAFLGKREERPLCYATTVRWDAVVNDAVGVFHHGSRIILAQSDGSWVLSSCGWQTVTTKRRLSWVAPVRSDRGQWWVSWGGQLWAWADGLTLHADGSVEGAMSEGEVKEQARLRRSAVNYAKRFTSALLAGKVGNPSAGDCVYCGWHDNGGVSIGEVFGSRDHIESHIDESYYVPSLLVNAVRLYPVSIMASDGVARVMAGEVLSDWQADIVREQVGGSLRRFVLHSLGIA